MRPHIRILLILLLGAAGSVYAQSTWEGNAVVGGFGEFPDEGFYAASNSFPQNQVVEVTNLETGETVDVIVAKRADQPGIFLVLSHAAARELGVERGEPARVRARPAAAAGGVIQPGSERALSRDPDVNPAATLGEEELYPAPVAEAEDDEGEDTREPEPEPDPDVGADGTVERRAEPDAGPRSGIGGGVGTTATRLADPRRAPDIGRAEAPARTEPVPEPAPSTGAPSEQNEVEEALRVVRDRFGGRDRFPPPREEGVATFLAPPLRADEELDFGDRVARVPDPPPAPADDRPAAEYLGRLAPPLEDLSPDLPGAGDPTAGRDTTAEDSLPPAIRPEDERRAEVPEDAVLTLEPAEERPPEKPAERVAETEEADEPEEPGQREEPAEAAPSEDLPLVRSLDRSRYYLQVGAYSSAGSARQAVERLQPEYPTGVLADGGDERTLYRVLVGPLNEDERGSVLYFVRAMGYRDAFIRQADG
ncbi:MAG: SPOR domain-containing protein [Spirochaetaceae bacterium]